MIPFKNLRRISCANKYLVDDNATSRGFSFIEIVVAITLIGTLVTALFNVHTTVLRSLMQSASRMQRVFVLTRELVATGMHNKEDKLEKQLNDPAMTLSVELKEPAPTSSLKVIKGLKLITLRGSWQQLGMPYQEILLGFLYNPAIHEMENKQS